MRTRRARSASETARQTDGRTDRLMGRRPTDRFVSVTSNCPGSMRQERASRRLLLLPPVSPLPPAPLSPCGNPSHAPRPPRALLSPGPLRVRGRSLLLSSSLLFAAGQSRTNSRIPSAVSHGQPDGRPATARQSALLRRPFVFRSIPPPSSFDSESSLPTAAEREVVGDTYHYNQTEDTENPLTFEAGLGFQESSHGRTERGKGRRDTEGDLLYLLSFLYFSSRSLSSIDPTLSNCSREKNKRTST